MEIQTFTYYEYQISCDEGRAYQTVAVGLDAVEVADVQRERLFTPIYRRFVPYTVRVWV